jgi:hypothetical protein
VIERDQILCDTPPLGLIGLQNGWISDTLHHQSQLPAEVIAILHRNIHTLASLGRVCMYSISSQEYAALVMEVLADSLADLVCRPPVAVFVCELVWCDNLLRRGDDGFRCDLGSVRPATGVGLDLCELDVEAGDFILTRNNHH